MVRMKTLQTWYLLFCIILLFCEVKQRRAWPSCLSQADLQSCGLPTARNRLASCKENCLKRSPRARQWRQLSHDFCLVLIVIAAFVLLEKGEVLVFENGALFVVSEGKRVESLAYVVGLCRSKFRYCPFGWVFEIERYQSHFSHFFFFFFSLKRCVTQGKNFWGCARLCSQQR